MSRPVRIAFLGGLGEIGRNCMAVEHDDRLLLIDCGLMFPDADMHGIDLVLPDFTWLRTNADRIEGCVVTHGHEDHVGALQYLLRDLSFPIYGSAVALGLANHVVPQGSELDKAKELIEKISAKGPVAIAKVIETVNAYFHTEQDGFASEVEAFGATTGTEDFKEGAAAFIEKRKAGFQGR